MPDKVDLLIEDSRWAAYPLQELAEQALALAISDGRGTPVGEISCLACSDERIATLNAKFRSKPAPTNVLSWPAHTLAPDTPGDPPQAVPIGNPFLGDIAIAFETTVKEAQSAAIRVEDHILHLLLHACLHLLGYDHETEEDAQRMENIEVNALASVGLKNPY